MIRNRFSRFIFFFLTVFFVACNPTKHVSQGEYLLKSVTVKIDNKNISREQVKSNIQQKPNKKIVGARFHLWLYNSAKPEKENKWNEWLRKNGEEPVIWEQKRTKSSVENLERFFQRKGYYYAHVTDTVMLKRKKAEVVYRIKTGWAYRINNVSYLISDTSIAKLVLADTLHTLVKPGMLLDEDVIKAEFKRIETHLKNNGYFSFSDSYIKARSDSTDLDQRAKFIIEIKPFTERTEGNLLVETPFPLYHFHKVKVNASLDMQNLMEADHEKTFASDTLKNGGLSFIIPQHFPVRASTIRNALFIFPDSLYRISNLSQTYQHLNGLRNFRQITPEFIEPSGQTGLPVRELDCMISLLPLPRHNYTVELEGTNSDGNLGGGARLQYQNISLFRHAEIFELRLHGLVEAVSGERRQFKAKMEYETEASLNIPKFLLPLPSSGFTRRYNPKTTFSISYNYQQYPEYYVRTVFNTSFGYQWRGSNVISHVVKLLDVNFVKLPDKYLSDNFELTLLRYPYLKNSYQSHMVVSSIYTLVRDMRLVNRENAFFVRTNLETAGLLLDAFSRATDKTKQPDSRSYTMFGNQFSQFVKGDVDLRYFFTVNNNNRMIVRTFAGIGFPYGNSKTTIETDDGATKTVVAMPFEKKYYAGGANSLRGWRLRSLGPGSYRDTTSLTSYPNNTGDVKIEANLEYRFKLVWLIEGALFMDAGNVWDTHRDDDRPGANFAFNRFYREIALSGGVGLRFDFKYVILRSDLGMKLRDPAGTGRWAFTQKENGSKIGWNDFCLSVAIGYPFF